VLRHRLSALRADIVERLVRDGIDGGSLSLLGGVNLAIQAIDYMSRPRRVSS
jgi:hypothetical protein